MVKVRVQLRTWVAPVVLVRGAELRESMAATALVAARVVMVAAAVLAALAVVVPVVR